MVGVLTISLMQFSACTWGNCDSSRARFSTGFRATRMSSSITSARDGFGALAESMPVMSAGIPADRRVVDTWVEIQFIAPYND